MRVVYKNQGYDTTVWTLSMGVIGDWFAYETTVARGGQNMIPAFILASVFNGSQVYFIRREDLMKFWQAHAACAAIMQSVASNIEVATQSCGYNFHPMIESGQLFDIDILFQLLVLARKGSLPPECTPRIIAEQIEGYTLSREGSLLEGFGEFEKGGEVLYTRIPRRSLESIALDSIVTYQVGVQLIDQCQTAEQSYTPGTNGIGGRNGIMAPPNPWGLLSHDIQLRGAIALNVIERRGLHTDPVRVCALDEELSAAIDTSKTLLVRYGYIPGEKGNQQEYNRIIREVERRQGVTVPLTKSGDKTQAADALAPIVQDEFVKAFLNFEVNSDLLHTFVDKLKNGVVYPHYNLLTTTGRTSCEKPNIQNLPRIGQIRECIVPTPGFVFLACDYSAVELCTLAQLTWIRYGQSRMRELINQGVDLHRFTASEILKKSSESVTPEERRKAKAVNFGLPGGMSVAGLAKYARSNYRVEMTAQEATQWREQWMNLFPEMRLYLQDRDTIGKLTGVYDLSDYPGPDTTAEIAAMILWRIAGGFRETSHERKFTPAELSWAWGIVEESPAATISRFRTAIDRKTGSKDLRQAILPCQVAITPSGRVRVNCTYNASRNTPFQGMAGDGCKLALYDLIKAGHRVAAFIHDEVLVEVPEAPDYRPAAEAISGIMIAAMRLICPDVTIRTEFAVMRRWCKGAKAVYDATDRLIVFDEVAA